MGGAEMVEPGDELAASEGGASHIIAWQADRNQVLDALKAAFVQGRLTKGEFDQRIGQVLAAYAELDAVTADLPAEPAPARMPEPARESHNRRVIQRGTADSAKPRQQARHDPRHTAEAARSRHTHLRTPGAAVQGV
jgi:Domain of unknown function (DUF1707)